VLVTKLNKIDILAGVFVIFIGCLAIYEALHFELGGARRMGPGYFPFYIGILLLVIGAGLMFEGRWLRQADGAGAHLPSLRGLLLILAAVICFALTIERFGLVVASLLAVFLGTLADQSTSMKQKLMLTVAVPIVCVLIFKFGLGLHVDIIRWRP
jgi:hypothetical protein